VTIYGGKADAGKPMAAMVRGVEQMKARFVLGLGDHVRGPKKETAHFIEFLRGNDWWKNHFYPTIADGENAYYGKGQSDWGAGKGLIDELALCQQNEVACRDNHVEYHATWKIEGVTVHFITAHYPDEGKDPFPADSQRYLVDEVSKIDRTDGKVIVIAAAHTGNWLKKMKKEDQETLLAKTDLLLGATTHIYGRYEYPDDKALFLNTGSTGYGLLNNYLQVSVMTAPLRLVVQNMNVRKDRALQKGPNCWVKEIGGKVSSCQFTHAQPW